MTAQRRLLLFCLAGAAGFLVDVGVLYAVAPLVGWWAGRVLSFLAAASATWQMNRRLAFADARAESRSGWRQYLRYLASMLGGAAVNYAVYAATLHAVSAGYAAALGVALGSVAGLAVNFLSARFLIFAKQQRKDP